MLKLKEKVDVRLSQRPLSNSIFIFPLLLAQFSGQET